jgi:invasion protein IalB
MPCRSRPAAALARRTAAAVLAAVLVAFLAAALASPAMAQQQQPAAPVAAGTDWRVECTNNGKALDCRAYLDVVQRDNNQVITSVTVRYPTETKKPVMMVQLPLGILVSEAVAIGVDAGQPERSTVQTCTQQGCFVGAPLPDAFINAMRTGKQLKIVFYNVNKQPVTVTISLNGFVLAYDKVKG